MIEDLPVDMSESRWVVEAPSYQIHFWKQLSTPAPPARPLWESDLHRLVGIGSVDEALQWAEAHSDGRMIAVYAEVDRGEANRGLVLLKGTDPTWEG